MARAGESGIYPTDFTRKMLHITVSGGQVKVESHLLFSLIDTTANYPGSFSAHMDQSPTDHFWPLTDGMVAFPHRGSQHAAPSGTLRIPSPASPGRHATRCAKYGGRGRTDGPTGYTCTRAQIVRCRDLQTGQVVAVKCLNREN